MPSDSNAGAEPVRVRIQTDAASGGSHEVLIGAGLINEAGARITAVSQAHRYAIITDSNVGPLHGRVVAASLEAAGASAGTLVFPAGESSKTRDSWSALTDEMLRREYGRDTCVVVVGGGVAGDLGGFVAATFMRGIPWVNVPTTLLAMLDSAVGGKTGVDTAAGKNLVGAFRQPALVLVDPEVLMTLPEQAYRASIAEAVKHGAIDDAQYFGWIDANAEAILSRDAGLLAELVRRSIEIKAAVVAEDTLEAGRRAILNFGHTIGHALERVTGYGLTHGEAVAIGMVLEARIGELAGVTEPGTSARIARSLARFGLRSDLSSVGAGAEAIMEATRSDKKARGSLVRYALVSRVGSAHRSPAGAWTHEVPDELVRRVTSAGPEALSQAGTEF
jgi:3-dehydroquinate synthase